MRNVLPIVYCIADQSTISCLWTDGHEKTEAHQRASAVLTFDVWNLTSWLAPSVRDTTMRRAT